MEQSILVIGDEANRRMAVRAHLERRGFQVAEAPSGDAARLLMHPGSYDLVVLDAPEACDRVTREARGIPVLRWEESARPADDEGLQSLSEEVDRALELGRLREELERLNAERRESFRAQRLIGESPKMRDLMALVGRICDSHATTILLEGPHGSGKQLVAETIHYGTNRSSRPFLEIDCTTFAEGHLEQELFGVEGAPFDDAPSYRRGLLEAADGGTLLIRSIEALPPSLQRRLLAFLDDRSFRRCGGNREIHVDVRLIVATRRSLTQEIDAGRFSEALFHRLSVVPVIVPSLAERREDIALLADHFLERANRKHGGHVRGFTPDAIACLQSYGWPGNIKELENVLERLVMLHDGQTIDVAELPQEISAGRASAANFAPPLGQMKLEEIEVQTLKAALDQTRHNQVRAASLLGISRDTLRYRMKKFGLLSRRQMRRASEPN